MNSVILECTETAHMKVLIIDDDKFIRNLFISELTQENFVVITAPEGVSGVELIKSEKPDVVVLDLLLPGLDGFGVLEAVKKLPDDVRAHIALFVFSSLGQEHDREEALALGATGYFPKDHATVRKVIDAIRERDAHSSTKT